MKINAIATNRRRFTMKTRGFLFAVAVATMAFTFSCSDESKPSEEVVHSYCVYPEDRVCFSGSYSECPGDGLLSNNCPYSSNSAVPSSSSSDDMPSSGSVEQSSSSMYQPPKMSPNVSIDDATFRWLMDSRQAEVVINVTLNLTGDLAPAVKGFDSVLVKLNGKLLDKSGVEEFTYQYNKTAGEINVETELGPAVPGTGICGSDIYLIVEVYAFGKKEVEMRTTKTIKKDSDIGNCRSSSSEYTYYYSIYGITNISFCNNLTNFFSGYGSNPSYNEVKDMWSIIKQNGDFLESDNGLTEREVKDFLVQHDMPSSDVNDLLARTKQRGNTIIGFDTTDPSHCKIMIYSELEGSSSSFSGSSSSVSLCGGISYNSSTQYCSNGTIKTYSTVTHEGQIYKTVVINNQTWLAENLKYNAEGSKCRNNDPANCTKYGRLYDWATAMALGSNCNEENCTCNNGNCLQIKHQGICPLDWHIPNYSDWNNLVTTVAKHFFAREGWDNCGYSGSGKQYECLDTYGFAVLPGAYLNGDSWWGNELSFDAAYGVSMHISNPNGPGRSAGASAKNNLNSVRCVKDY